MSDALGHQLGRTHLHRKPIRNLGLVGHRPLTEPEGLTDLRPMALDRASCPRVALEVLHSDRHLPSDVGDGRLRDVLRSPRKASLQLEELQQQREAQPGRPRLVRDQLPVLPDQGPGANELVGVPVRPHSARDATALVLARRPTRYLAPGDSFGSPRPIPLVADAVLAAASTAP
jgi:hypothetical protein